MKSVLFIIICLMSASAALTGQDIQKEKWHWGVPEKQDTNAGYAQVVKAGNVLYISGAVALEVTPEGITQVYRTLERSLQSFGATFQDRKSVV